MSDIIKKALIVFLFVVAGVVFVNALHDDVPIDNDVPSGFYNYIEDHKLNSSRFSRPEDMRSIDPDTIIPITDNDQYLMSNDNFVLYMNQATLNFKVFNKTTSYVWSTAMDEPDAGTYNSLLSSGIGIEYINKEQNMSVRENVGLLDTQFSTIVYPREDGVSINIDIADYCATRRCRDNYDAYLDGDFTLEQMIQFGLVELGVAFTLNITLNETGITAEIPFHSIVETETDWTTLSSIIVFPALGATFMESVPGYMIIPDGIGTLIRYEDNERRFRTPYEAPIYGSNVGLAARRRSMANYPITMPIFGAVHGVRQNAFIGIIESGDFNARLMAYPNGANNLDYNLIFPKFDYKQRYRQSFTRDGADGARRVADTSYADVIVHYHFLDNNQAHYTGVAEAYRNYLIEQGSLDRNETTQSQIPLHISLLMADSTNRFIGQSLIQMTSVDAAKRIYNDLYDAGLTHQLLSLKGWNQGGYSGHYPAPVNFERRLGRERDFIDFIAHVAQDNRVYLVNNYIQATNATSRVSYRNDVALGVNRFKIVDTFDNFVYPERYKLYPDSATTFALEDINDYQALDVHVLHEGVGSMLFSYYRRNTFTREDTYEALKPLFEAYANQAGYAYPNAYIYPYTDTVFNMPLFNSQLKYFDDLIPLLPLVLSGHMEMYSRYLNFNSLGREQLLAMIDFGIYPSYIISDARASDLRGSDVEHFYTTRYDHWRESIIHEYEFINDALRHVMHAVIVDRVVLDTGVVSVHYDNGVHITINYTTSEYEKASGVIVPPLDIHIGGDGP